MDRKEKTDSTPEESKTDGNSTIADAGEGDIWDYKWIIVVGTIVIVAGFGIFFFWKKMRHNTPSSEKIITEEYF